MISASRANLCELQGLGPAVAGSMPARAQRVARRHAARARRTAPARCRSIFRRCVNIDRTIASNTARRRVGTAGGRNVSRTTAEWTFGAGRNAPGGSVSSRPDVGVQPGSDRQHAVVAGAGRGHQPLGHLALQHQRRVRACGRWLDARRAAGTGSATRCCRAGCRRPAAAQPPASGGDVEVEEVGLRRGSRWRAAAARAPPTISRSISTAVRCATRGASLIVSAPGPGPISRNRSVGRRRDRRDQLVGPGRLEEVLAVTFLRARIDGLRSRSAAAQTSSSDSPRQYFSSISSICSSLIPK